MPNCACRGDDDPNGTSREHAGFTTDHQADNNNAPIAELFSDTTVSKFHEAASFQPDVDFIHN
jgi:hypothetical protein